MIALLFQFVFVFLFIGTLYAASAEKAAPSKISPTPLYKMENLKMMKQPATKIPPKMIIRIPANTADQKADLHCSINAYYDQNRMKQIEGHLWDFSTAVSYGIPQPWYLQWEIVVMNSGMAKAQNFVTNFDFISPTGQHYIFNETETLEPGEAAVFKYRYGPFGPGSTYLYGKNTVASVKTDFPARVNESNEGNNNCNSYVRFVP